MGVNKAEPFEELFGDATLDLFPGDGREVLLRL